MSAGSMMQLSGFVSLSWNSDSDTLHLSTHKEIHTGYKQLDLVEVAPAHNRGDKQMTFEPEP